jgi:hypothetical protein
MGRVGLNGFAFVPAATGGSEIYFRILVSALQRGEGDDEYVLFVRRRVRAELPVADRRFRVVAITEPSPLANALRVRVHRPMVELHPRWRDAMRAADLDLAHYPYTTSSTSSSRSSSPTSSSCRGAASTASRSSAPITSSQAPSSRGRR